MIKLKKGLEDTNMSEQKHDYIMERRLRELNPQLHRQFTDSVFALQRMLSNFLILFPTFTDHSELHSMSVIELCNELIGEEQILKMSDDEIYVLLMACYLHDVGMGVMKKDYEKFKEQLGADAYFSEHPNADAADFVRDFHHEFSGLVIEKYAELFELPSEAHLFAIKQVARGHRKTDLYDEKEYPSNLKMPSGSSVNLPYLAALIRLADEIDVVALRNPKMLYDMESLTREIDILEFSKHNAISALDITDEAFTMIVSTDKEELYSSIVKLRDKMQKTLDYCRDVTKKRSTYTISQEHILIDRQ